MLSIVICSISPERLLSVSQNIHDTIGVDYEIIAIDNRERNLSIAKAYNEGAQQARYPNLFFVHEDVKFHSQDWGRIIEAKLSEPDCGVIGFAGSKAMTNSYSGWTQYNCHWNIAFYFFAYEGKPTQLDALNVTLEDPYVPVAVLDGFALFVRRNVWQEFPFDEELITGFHCYDIDFSLQVGRKFNNYVCGLHIWIEHLSSGSFSAGWAIDTIRLYRNKWKYQLPVAIEGLKLTQKDYSINEEIVFYRFLSKILRMNVPHNIKAQILKEFWRRPLGWKHFMHCLSCSLKYLRTL